MEEVKEDPLSSLNETIPDMQAFSHLPQLPYIPVKLDPEIIEIINMKDSQATIDEESLLKIV